MRRLMGMLVVSVAEAVKGRKEISSKKLNKNLIIFFKLIEAKILPIDTNLVIAFPYQIFYWHKRLQTAMLLTFC